MENQKEFEVSKEPQQKEEISKLLLKSQIVIGVLGLMFLFSLIAIASYVEMQDWLRIVLMVSGFVIFIAAALFALKLEQSVGFYKCKNCGHKYVPTYKQVGAAMHIWRTRYMKGPKCNHWSWSKKVTK